MNLLPRWLRSDAQRKADEHEPDPGDMGTAFGLDASLGPLEDEPATATAAAESDSRWQQRLDRRPLR